MDEAPPVADLLAALTYGERKAAARARDNVRFAPDDRRRKEQEAIADREERNARLVEARLRELGSDDLATRFGPFFDVFFDRTEPVGWLEAQAWHYVGDALVSDFADVMIAVVDPVSAEIVRRSLGERQEQESFALDELSSGFSEDPAEAERVAGYARRIVGEALTQTRRAMQHTGMLRNLLGGEEGEKRLVLDLLERHRVRLDRLGIDPVDLDPAD